MLTKVYTRENVSGFVANSITFGTGFSLRLHTEGLNKAHYAWIHLNLELFDVYIRIFQ